MTSEEVHERILVNGLRRVTDDLTALLRMSHAEYELRMKAATMRRADLSLAHAQLAMFIARAGVVNKENKFVVDRPSMLFDISNVENEIYGKTNEQKQIFGRLRKIADRLKRRKRG